MSPGPISRQPCHRRTAGYDALNIGHQMQLVLEAGNLQYPSLIGLALSSQRPRKVPPLANKDLLTAEGCRCKCRVGRVWVVADTPFPGAASVGPFREHPKGSKKIQVGSRQRVFEPERNSEPSQKVLKVPTRAMLCCQSWRVVIMSFQDIVTDKTKRVAG